MRTLLSLAAFLIMSVGAASAATTQPLALRIDAAGVHATTLQHYRADVPLSLDIRSVADGTSAITVAATRSDGAVVRTPLAMQGANHFIGSMLLTGVGTWNIALETLVGGAPVTSAPLALDVVEAPDSTPALIVSGLAALFAAVGIVGFVLMRRSMSAPAAQQASFPTLLAA